MDARKPLLVASGVCWGACSISHSLQLKGVKSDNVSSTVFRYAALGALQLVVLWALIQLSYLWSAALRIIALSNNDRRAAQRWRSMKMRLYGYMTPIAFWLILSPPFFIILSFAGNRFTQKIALSLGFVCIQIQGNVLIMGLEYFPGLFGLLVLFLAGVVCTCFVGLLNDPNEWIDLPVCRVITALLSTIIMFLCGIYVYLSSRRNSPTATTDDH